MTLQLTIDLINIISQAGKAMMSIYNSGDFGVEIKSDDSPLTKADKAANEIITAFLSTTDLPILSEESKTIDYQDRKDWDSFWLVDPLDGTKEFIKKNGEFTINVALIKNGEPVAGFVYAPFLQLFYIGTESLGAVQLDLIPGEEIETLDHARILQVQKPGSEITVVASKSHFNEETKNYIAALEEQYENVEFISKGSSLKLCMVAEGKAHLYPRFGPTMEWDTAAAHAVVLAAGGQVLTPQGEPLRYNKESLLNPYFIVSA